MLKQMILAAGRLLPLWIDASKVDLGSVLHSYQGKGVADQSPYRQSMHTMVYSGSSVPSLLPGESCMTKEALQVVTKPGLGVAQPCRIRLDGAYLIDHRSKVQRIGCMTKSSILKLLEYREEIWKRNHIEALREASLRSQNQARLSAASFEENSELKSGTWFRRVLC